MQNNPNQIVGAIIIAGALIAGAILLKGSSMPSPAVNPGTGAVVAKAPAPVTKNDQIKGNPDAKISVVMYEDYQCPFCDKFFKEVEETVIDNALQTGKVNLVYRDFAFLGPESVRAAEAARCAADQGKYWEYHDYLFNHQNGENQGSFADPNLKLFAKTLSLNTDTFNNCLDTGKYAKSVADSKTEGGTAGVTGTPKGFILKSGKVVATIDGAEPSAMVQAKIDGALK